MGDFRGGDGTFREGKEWVGMFCGERRLCFEFYDTFLAIVMRGELVRGLMADSARAANDVTQMVFYAMLHKMEILNWQRKSLDMACSYLA